MPQAAATAKEHVLIGYGNSNRTRTRADRLAEAAATVIETEHVPIS